jgi:hypothetical protein
LSSDFRDSYLKRPDIESDRASIAQLK